LIFVLVLLQSNSAESSHSSLVHQKGFVVHVIFYTLQRHDFEFSINGVTLRLTTWQLVEILDDMKLILLDDHVT